MNLVERIDQQGEEDHVPLESEEGEGVVGASGLARENLRGEVAVTKGDDTTSCHEMCWVS